MTLAWKRITGLALTAALAVSVAAPSAFAKKADAGTATDQPAKVKPKHRGDRPPRPPRTIHAIDPATIDPANLWYLKLSDGGTVVIELRPDKAPNHVERIRALTEAGFYNNLTFHRVIDGFMAQGGDPRGTGEGGSSLPNLAAEFNDLPHMRGAVAMARANDKDSANSQFYIVFQPTFKLDNHYTVFGRVVSGMAYVDAIQQGEPPENPTRILQAWIGSDGPNAPRRMVPGLVLGPPPAAVVPGAGAPAAASGADDPATGEEALPPALPPSGN